MKSLQKDLINKITRKPDPQNPDNISDTQKIAKNSLRALMQFNKGDKDNKKYHDLTPDVKNKIKIKEACNAMIAHLFLDNKQKRTMRMIFKIMDYSGDGHLEEKELQEDLEEEQDLLVQVEILVERIVEEQEIRLQQVQLKDLMEDKILEEVKTLVLPVVVEL